MQTPSTEPGPRPASWTVRVLAGLLVFQGVSGVAGGLALVADPSGGFVGLSRELLEGSPFRDYLVPGLILISVLGVVPLGAAYGVWKRRAGAGLASLLVGIALVVWIGVEVAVIGFRPNPPLQPLYGALGLAIAVLSLLPPVRRSMGSGP